MYQRYKNFFNMIISIVFVIAGLIITFAPIKIILLISALWFFSNCFKKGFIFFIILGILSFCAIFFNSIITNMNINLDFSKFPFIISNYEKSSETLFTTIMEPDKKIKIEESIFINITSGNIKFDETRDDVFLSSELRISRNNGNLEIISPNINKSDNKKYIIYIGTKNKLRKIVLDTTSLNLSGTLNAESLKINSTSLDINGKYKVDSNLIIDSTSFNGSNIKFACKTLDLNSTSLNLDGFLSASEANLDTTSLNIDLKVNNLEKFMINCTSANGNVYYQDKWNNERFVYIDKSSGNISIEKPDDITGTLIISGND